MTDIHPCLDEDPEEVSGDPVDEREVLGDAAGLADPAAWLPRPEEEKADD